MCVWDEHLTTTIRREWRGRRMLVAEVKIHLVSWWTNYFLRFLSSSSHMVSFLGKFTLQDQREMTHLPFELVEGLKRSQVFCIFLKVQMSVLEFRHQENLLGGFPLGSLDFSQDPALRSWDLKTGSEATEGKKHRMPQPLQAIARVKKTASLLSRGELACLRSEIL